MKNSIDRLLKQLIDLKEQRTFSIRPYAYEIGIQRHQYNLCFDIEPNASLYYNSIFIKILSFKNINQAIDCIHYHYRLYSNNNEFLDFFENEVLDVSDTLLRGISLPSDRRKQRILSACQRWITSQRELTKSANEAVRLNRIESEIADLIRGIKNTRIEMNPQVDSKKLILLFLALQKLIVDDKKVGVLRYKHTVELPHILKYFAPYSENKIDGIRKLTTLLASDKNLQLNIPEYLSSALQRFFFAESVQIREFDD